MYSPTTCRYRRCMRRQQYSSHDYSSNVPPHVYWTSRWCRTVVGANHRNISRCWLQHLPIMRDLSIYIRTTAAVPLNRRVNPEQEGEPGRGVFVYNRYYHRARLSSYRIIPYHALHWLLYFEKSFSHKSRCMKAAR